MLSNLETEKSKLIQIVLVGQPNLRDLLARPELEQLRQRVTVSYHLQALDAGETAAYINHRLRKAAIGAPLEFSRDVTDLIHLHSEGHAAQDQRHLPTRCCCSATARRSKRSTVDLTREAIDGARGDRRASRRPVPTAPRSGRQAAAAAACRLRRQPIASRSSRAREAAARRARAADSPSSSACSTEQYRAAASCAIASAADAEPAAARQWALAAGRHRVAETPRPQRRRRHAPRGRRAPTFSDDRWRRRSAHRDAATRASGRCGARPRRHRDALWTAAPERCSAITAFED